MIWYQKWHIWCWHTYSKTKKKWKKSDQSLTKKADDRAEDGSIYMHCCMQSSICFSYCLPDECLLLEYAMHSVGPQRKNIRLFTDKAVVSYRELV